MEKKIKYTNEPLEMNQTEPDNCESNKRCPWIRLGVVFLLIYAAITVLGRNAVFFHKPDDFPPPFPPVSVNVVYTADSIMNGMNFKLYGGTARYTFKSNWPHPITLSFPPICYYTYNKNQQDGPFPSEDRHLPEFAKEQREVVIPAWGSVTYTSKFNIMCPGGETPDMHCAFVFGPPKTPCEYPMLGTIYGSAQYKESADVVK